MPAPTEDQVLEALRVVQDPDLHRDIVTLGFVNPRKMVDTEVKKSLDELGRVVNAGLWWVSVQIALRVAFGLTLWTAWAIHS